MEPALLDELAEFIRIPSVSADPAHAADIRRASDWLAALLRGAGGRVEVIETEANPLVVGDFPASNDADRAPTVLAYGHYDVQPPAPLDLWESDPFELTVRDEWVYGRGVADDKGQLYLLAKAVAELAAEGSLPVNVRVVSDGEEEIGGRSVVEFLARDAGDADACIIYDGGFERRGVPMFGIGTRGLLDMNLSVRTGERDLHSGLFGNAALNAIHALTQALSAVLPRNGRLPDPLRAGATPLTGEERTGLAELTPGADVLRDAGAAPYDAEAPGDFYERTLAEPALDVNGILGGKPGLTNTTVPAAAQANFTMRLAPGQDPGATFETLERMIRDAAPPAAQVELTLKQSAAGALVAPDSHAVRLGVEAFERVFGRRPLLVRSGGTLPIMPALVERGIPAIIAGVALPESNIHSPNERLLLEYLPLGLAAARELFVSFARLR